MTCKCSAAQFDSINTLCHTKLKSVNTKIYWFALDPDVVEGKGLRIFGLRETCLRFGFTVEKGEGGLGPGLLLLASVKEKRRLAAAVHRARPVERNVKAANVERIDEGQL